MRLEALQIGDPAERWEALGFAVVEDRLELGSVTLVLGGDGEGIMAWSLPALDGLANFDASRHPGAAAQGAKDPGTAAQGANDLRAAAHGAKDLRAAAHPNGATSLDHVVVVTPDFDRTAQALDHQGLALKRVRDAGGFRQGFRRVGEPILELVEAHAEGRPGPARFWGLVPVVADLDALKARLGALISEPKPAVQRGRRIATLRAEAGLSCALAFMDPGA